MRRMLDRNGGAVKNAGIGKTRVISGVPHNASAANQLAGADKAPEVTSAKTLEAELGAWRDAINGGFSNGGVFAISAGIAAIKKYQDRLDPVVTKAKKQLAVADTFAANTPGTDCEKKAATIYQLVQLISPHVRLERIGKLQKAVADLQTKAQSSRERRISTTT